MREGTYVYLWLIYVDLWQKPTQYCKAIILQLKINSDKKEMAVLSIYQEKELKFRKKCSGMGRNGTSNCCFE